jgi:hypothetical protein
MESCSPSVGSAQSGNVAALLDPKEYFPVRERRRICEDGSKVLIVLSLVQCSDDQANAQMRRSMSWQNPKIGKMDALIRSHYFGQRVLVTSPSCPEGLMA